MQYFESGPNDVTKVDKFNFSRLSLAVDIVKGESLTALQDTDFLNRTFTNKYGNTARQREINASKEIQIHHQEHF
jgi:hypothetical protein